MEIKNLTSPRIMDIKQYMNKKDAQYYMVDNQETKSNYLLAQQKEFSTGYEYLIINNTKDIEKLIIQNKRLNDVFNCNFAKKVCFDIDIKNLSKEDYGSTHQNTFDEIFIFIEQLEKLWNYELEYCIQTGSRKVEDNFKVSFHVIIYNVFYCDIKQFKQYLQQIISSFKDIPLIKKFLDYNIYGNDKLFRLIGCKKSTSNDTTTSFLRKVYPDEEQKLFKQIQLTLACYVNCVRYGNLQKQMQAIIDNKYLYLDCQIMKDVQIVELSLITTNEHRLNNSIEKCKEYLKTFNLKIMENIEIKKMSKIQTTLLTSCMQNLNIRFLYKHQKVFMITSLLRNLLLQFDNEQLIFEMYVTFIRSVVKYRQDNGLQSKEEFYSNDYLNNYFINQVINWVKEIYPYKKILEMLQSYQDEQLCNVKLSKSINKDKKRIMDIEGIKQKYSEHINRIDGLEKYIEWEKHECVEIDQNENSLLAIDGMCSCGKSFSMKQRLILKDDQIYISLTDRLALQQQQTTDYQDSCKVIQRMDIDQIFKAEQKTMLMIQLQSMNLFIKYQQQLENTEYILIIDEIVSFFQDLFDPQSSFHIQSKRDNILAFKMLILNAKKIIIMDANTTVDIICYIMENGIRENLQYIYHDKITSFENVYITHEQDTMKRLIFEDISQKKKIAICSITQMQIETIYQELEQNRIQNNKIKKQATEDINSVFYGLYDTGEEHRDFDMIHGSIPQLKKFQMKLHAILTFLYNGAIMCGIDIQSEIYNLYCYVDMEITPQQIYQLINRCRKVKNIYFHFNSSRFKYNPYEVLEYIQWDNLENIDVNKESYMFKKQIGDTLKNNYSVSYELAIKQQEQYLIDRVMNANKTPIIKSAMQKNSELYGIKLNEYIYASAQKKDQCIYFAYFRYINETDELPDIKQFVESEMMGQDKIKIQKQHDVIKKQIQKIIDYQKMYEYIEQMNEYQFDSKEWLNYEDVEYQQILKRININSKSRKLEPYKKFTDFIKNNMIFLELQQIQTRVGKEIVKHNQYNIQIDEKEQSMINYCDESQDLEVSEKLSIM